MMNKTIRRFRRYLRAIDGFDSILCIIDELLKREILRSIRIRGIDVYVRTNTPDVRVAINSLFYKEYEHIRCLDPKIIIDAGANIGTSAIYFSRKYPHARVIAIEPEEGNFYMLLKNTRAYRNITAIRVAIWGTAEKREIQNRYTGHWGYTITDTHNRTESTGQEVECVTVGTLMETYGINKIDLLKMDIEGSEKGVLENSSDWIDAVEILTAELHDSICMGCDRAFYLATEKFRTFEKHGEKVTAYRQ